MKTRISQLLAVAMTLLVVGCQHSMAANYETCFDELKADHPYAWSRLTGQGTNYASPANRSYPSKRDLELFEPALEKNSECLNLQLAMWQSQGIDAQSSSDYLRAARRIGADLLRGELTYSDYLSLYASNYAEFERRISDQRYAEKAGIMEESDQKSLACISAGGRPIYDRRYDLIGDSELVYERCVANVQQATRSERPQYKSSVPDLPVTFEPRDRGQTCQTRRTGNNGYSTTCSPR